MANLPKIDSEGLRLAKKLGADRVSSVMSVSKELQPLVLDVLNEDVLQSRTLKLKFPLGLREQDAHMYERGWNDAVEAITDFAQKTRK